jgi:hypothetical protein
MWAAIVMSLLGIWLMVAPGVFDFSKKISDNAHIVGPLIATFSIIAIFECTRNVRYASVPLALWLLVSPWVIQYNNNMALWNDYSVAVLIIVLSLVKPKKKNRYGGGWPAAWRANTLHAREAGNPDRIQLKGSK